MTDAPLHALLEVQRLDTAADQLVHRRAGLPERAALASLREEVDRHRAALDEARARAHELERTQRRFEDEITLVEEKATTADRQLYSGSVTAAGELQALQEQVTSLRRRISGMEDDLLAVLEELEPVSAEVARLEAAHAEAEGRAADLAGALAEAESAIDAELGEVRAARAGLVTSVPDDLVARYEKIRARAGGVGIAVLDAHHHCTGCHLALPNREVDELRRSPTGTVVVHDECGRILVLQP
jgi:hypothetical protein